MVTMKMSQLTEMGWKIESITIDDDGNTIASVVRTERTEFVYQDDNWVSPHGCSEFS